MLICHRFLFFVLKKFFAKIKYVKFCSSLCPPLDVAQKRKIYLCMRFLCSSNEKGQEIFEQWLCSNKLMHLHAWTVPLDNKCILVSFVGVNLVIHVVSGATAPPK
jgi:hypothetical protein